LQDLTDTVEVPSLAAAPNRASRTRPVEPETPLKYATSPPRRETAVPAQVGSRVAGTSVDRAHIR